MTHATPAHRDHGYHRLEVARVVAETAEASSFVLAVPPDLAPAFAYEAGQFCTFRVWVDGEPVIRCYSMSSAPAVGDDLQVTVKRVPGGAASNWMIDNLAAGDAVEVQPPAGYFRLTNTDAVLVAFAAGSGITPVFSLIKTALATTARPVHLLYANRDRDAVIFDRELATLAAIYGDRLRLVHHFDVEHGFVGPDEVNTFLGPVGEGAFYICGPGPFMDVVEAALVARGVAPEHIHIERFTPAEPKSAPPAAETTPATATTAVTIELDGRTETVTHRAGATILQTARQAGLSPPSSCESGSCATCMARCVEGAVSMYVNNALTPEEVEEGWILTCQSLPTTPSVHVVYGYD
jgi:ferredoxin-NADP reductase